jgi:acyl carrier protein
MQTYAQNDLQKIKEILSQILGQEILGDDENFYEAGLTSIMVLPLLSEVEAAFDLKIPDTDFLDAHTPKQLAQLVQRLRGN